MIVDASECLEARPVDGDGARIVMDRDAAEMSAGVEISASPW
jgi:hypothetical protein